MPTIILTGASGFVGRNLLEDLKDDYRIFAIARRSQQECNAPVHPNIAWIRADISIKESITRAMREVQTAGGADYLFHLAAFYEFAGEEHPEYYTTNVLGTAYILELCAELNLKLFIFASSLAACNFPSAGESVDESSPADGWHIYARSKSQGEELVKAYAVNHRACIVRFGAVYSDWCEYPPLYVLLVKWLGSSWDKRVLAGKGQSAIPYIHIRDVIAFFHKLLQNSHRIQSAQVLIASTAGATTHERLYQYATRSFFGKESKPIHIPRLICAIGMYVMDFLGKLTDHRPFLRPWMHLYIDKKLPADNTDTSGCLNWTPNPRYLIEARMPFLVERMKSEPYAWQMKNMVAMRRVAARPDFNIYTTLSEAENEIIDRLISKIELLPDSRQYSGLKSKSQTELIWFYKLLFRLVLTSIHSHNKLLIQNYFEISGISRFEAGFTSEELITLLHNLNDIIIDYLNHTEKVQIFRNQFYDYVSMPLIFGIDEIEHQNTIFEQRRSTRVAAGEVTTVPVDQSARELLEETIWSCLVHRK